jgi:pimeloyl-ACP methyl ester carboxylesterase
LTNSKVRKAIGFDTAQGRLADEYSIFIRLKIPEFIIAGEQDRSVTLNYLKEVKDACKGNCELKMIKNCGHYPSLGQSEAFNTIIKSITDKVFN